MTEPSALDDEVEVSAHDASDVVAFPNDSSTGAFFFPASVTRVALFSLIGSWFYAGYWMYRAWAAYRRAWGYSREPFWRKVHARTGYRVSPVWRAILGSAYCFALFPAVDRECRAAGVPGLRAPLLLALVFSAVRVFGDSESLWLRLASSPVWALVPAQLAINRLNTAGKRASFFGIEAAEWAWLGVGAMVTLGRVFGSD
jgi:hypothetical protein